MARVYVTTREGKTKGIGSYLAEDANFMRRNGLTLQGEVDAEIKELVSQEPEEVPEFNGSEGAQPTEPGQVQEPVEEKKNWREVVKEIKAAETLEELAQYSSDDRKSVQAALEEKMNEFEID